ncbi:hypothetical protein ACFPM3_30460 [Streptomyces coeruleoprunus]|uniref:Uncharacterized protein n=1 Tax=Streptomyces coeruleoprunus TaxID=285563 RepID=A0ABV9XPP2_9ACTN
MHTITLRLPNPLCAAAIAALLFAGTDKSLLSMTQIGSVDEAQTTVAIDRDSRINIGEPPGPRHMYAVPPSARPLLRAVELWTERPFPILDEDGMDPRLRQQMLDYRADTGVDLPPGALVVMLSCWRSLYGQIALEVFGHLPPFSLIRNPCSSC